MSAGYPILLDLSGKKMVIIGGGAVGLRKAVKLIEAGATDVTVVAKSFTDGFPPVVRKVFGEYEPGQLTEASLVFAATNSPRVNDAILKECRRRHIWVSRADEESGDFTAAAASRHGQITAAVWAGSPAVAATVRDKIDGFWDNRWTQLAEAMQTIRPMVLENVPDARRPELLRRLSGDEALAKLSAGGVDSLMRWMVEQINAKLD